MPPSISSLQRAGSRIEEILKYYNNCPVEELTGKGESAPEGWTLAALVEALQQVWQGEVAFAVQCCLRYEL